MTARIITAILFCTLFFWAPAFAGAPAPDTRVTAAIIVSDDHYHADTLFPELARWLEANYPIRTVIIHGRGGGDFENMEALRDADVALLFIRRIAVKSDQMKIFREYLESGKPLMAFRTASHAFSLSFDGKTESPEGYEQWKTFNTEILGESYHNHGPNDAGTDVTFTPSAGKHPIYAGIDCVPYHSTGSLYFTSPVDEKATIFQYGSFPGHEKEPLTWLRSNSYGGLVLYTGLGHWDDFADVRFQKMVANAILFLHGDGFARRHDAAAYGEFLPARKIPDSPPSMGICIHGNYLYTTGYGHLTVYDLTDPRAPRPVQKVGGITEGRQLAFYKNHLYVTARTGGLYVFDAADPANLVLCSRYDTMELATGIRCADDVAYVCQRQFGTEFIDISDPRAPRHLGFVLSGEAQSVDGANGILYAGDWGSKALSIIDVRNSKNPKILGTGALEGLGDGVYVRGNCCYAATGPSKLRMTPSLGHGLDIFSLENLREPKRVGRFDFPAQAVHKSPDFWSVAVNERQIAYVSDSFNGVFCLNVSNPAQPKSLAHSVLPTVERTANPDPAGGLAVGDGVIYVAGTQGGVYVIETPLAERISEERACPVLNEPTLAEEPFDPELTRDFAILPTRGQALAAAVWRENFVWLAAGDEGLLLVDISGENPKILRNIPTEGFAYDVKLDGDRLFSAEGEAGTAIYQVQDDTQLALISRIETAPTQPVRQVVVPDPKRWLTTKSGNSTITFYDISDPAAPRPAFRDVPATGILYGRDLVDGVSPCGDMVCVGQETGLRWYDLTGGTPRLRGITFPGQVSFSNGACWAADRLLFFRYGTVHFCPQPESFESPETPQSVQVKDLPRFGKAVPHGNQIVFTDRREGIVTFVDMTNPEKPHIIRKYTFHGHPELAVFAGNRAIIPAGHFGLLVEK